MNRRNLLAIIATGTVAACAGYGGGPAPARPLAYEVPSPPMANYHFSDSMSISMTTPGGDMVIGGVTSATLGMTFARDAGGVRVTSTVDAFEASMNNPMTGTQSVGADAVSGNLEFVIGRRGAVEVTSLPELSGELAQLSPFAAIAHEMFPPLPDHVVETGGIWVDTVTWTTDAESMETTSTGILTFTLVGDTVVDGRTLLNFAMTGEVAAEATVNQGGMAITQDMEGSQVGFILWDTERGLPVYEEAERELEGTTSVPGMGSFPMSTTGTTRIRLTN